ncbi:hypothetical protein ACIQH5_00390 [Paenarthrobacter sp. NPDC091711]|uniref:hypothetical protein n=1 Tax=Paenarthrobacter sp. NPDC091711 TaxID=3364385 RepID=UPI0038144174
MSNRWSRSDKATSVSYKYRFAAALLMVQGLFMEGGVFVAGVVLWALGIEQSVVGMRFQFIVPFFQEHLYLLMMMSGVFGAMRIIGAVGLARNREWGFSLSLINCVVTLALMIFLLPAGIADGVLSGTALVLILLGRHGSSPIRNMASDQAQ